MCHHRQPPRPTKVLLRSVIFQGSPRRPLRRRPSNPPLESRTPEADTANDARRVVRAPERLALRRASTTAAGPPPRPRRAASRKNGAPNKDAAPPAPAGVRSTSSVSVFLWSGECFLFIFIFFRVRLFSCSSQFPCSLFFFCFFFHNFFIFSLFTFFFARYTGRFRYDVRPKCSFISSSFSSRFPSVTWLFFSSQFVSTAGPRGRVRQITRPLLLLFVLFFSLFCCFFFNIFPIWR